MADIELVIKIPEADYECLMNTTFVANLELWCKQSAKDRQQTKALFALVDALHDGKPLPKHHGRLIDASKLEVELECGIRAGNYEEGYEKYAHINDMDDCVDAIVFADTVIEADKESET